MYVCTGHTGFCGLGGFYSVMYNEVIISVMSLRVKKSPTLLRFLRQFLFSLECKRLYLEFAFSRIYSCFFLNELASLLLAAV